MADDADVPSRSIFHDPDAVPLHIMDGFSLVTRGQMLEITATTGRVTYASDGTFVGENVIAARLRIPVEVAVRLYRELGLKLALFSAGSADEKAN